ncbi:MAG: alpha/beta hydrolase [candidate division Zixibacteria bacterium]|nr:alpha/beta hydrolase [candidate division Zixibacteria bacterium]
MAFFDAGDAAIYYEITGEGEPLMLLHGYALNSLMWEMQIPALAEKYQVITVDLRGFGQSSCGKSWSGNAMADDISGLVKHLDLKSCTMLGFSLSGAIAFRIAYFHPDRIARLIMVSASLPSSGAPRKRAESLAQKRELDILMARGVDGWADKAGFRSGPLVGNIFKRNPEAEPIWERILKRHNPEFLRQMMEARANSSPSENWRDKLAEITQPTLIVAGGQDKRFIDASHYFQRKIPNAQLQTISGAGHMLNLEKPEEFNRVVLEFLESYE